MTNRLLALGLQLLLVFYGYSLIEIFTANLIINILVDVWQGIVIYRQLNNYKPVLFKALPERKELYHFGFWTWLQTIIAVASYQMDRFMIAWFLGTATVTYYVLAATIANHLHMAFEAVVSWMLPKVSRLKESLADTRMHFHTIRAFSVGFSLIVILGLYVISEPLFTLWLGPEKYAKMIVFFKLFLVFEAFLVLSIIPKLYLNAIKSLTFITMLEFMYKTAIILFMIISFFIYRTAESLIWGQIAALIVFMPVEYYLVNRKILKENVFRESFLNMIPSVCVMLTILYPSLPLKLLFGTLAMMSYYLIYLRDKNFSLKLLTE